MGANSPPEDIFRQKMAACCADWASVLQPAHTSPAALGKAGGAGGKFGHDGTARLMRQARPGGDFLDRAIAADADTFGGMDGAKLDAR